MIDYGKPGGLIQYFIFAVKVLFYCLKSDSDIFYSRDEMPLWFLSIFNKKVFWEVHTGKWNFLVSDTVKRCHGIITISNGIKKYFENKNIDGDKILVSPDAVDIEQFSLDIKKNDARKKIGLPSDKKIILYTGHLYAWKGADTLANSAKEFNEEYLFVFVGGNINHVNDLKKRFSNQDNIMILGQKPHEDIPFYLKSADVLVIPNSGKEDVSRLYTSPMKLFEYMASGTPIIASNLPSIREIIDEDGAVFFEPDNPESLARSIKKIFDNSALADKMANNSKINSQKYSWQRRAEGIINFISSR
ncbi:MAG TPA: glycosyltransferase family 4 protein [Candidatus Paceibacterota bacterium]|nr:glycosyltransferase family 4 protein [Candidatus Paceibacterota bacterium]